MKINLQEQFNDAVKLVEKGSREQLNDAEDVFNALFNIDENSPELLFQIGTLFIRKKYFALAYLIFKRSVELNDKIFCSWNNMGYVCREQRKITEAIEAFRRATDLGPEDSDAWMNLAAMYVACGTPNIAIDYANKALKINPENANALWNRALAHLEKGDYKHGWRDYDAGVRTSDRAVRNYPVGDKELPKWDGSKEKTVIVYGEQGIGDEIMFASMLPDMAQDCRIIFDAHPRLYKIFRHSFPNMTIYGTRKDKKLAWPELHTIDARIPIGSLGSFYRKKKEDFQGLPYLKADPKLVEKYQQKLNTLSDKIKIGISWQGGTKQTNSNERFIKLKKWLPLFDAIDADFISLQYTDSAAMQVENLQQEHGMKVHHWQETIDDYDETAGLVTALDFIFSVPQSVVHLAGALGTPTIQLTPKKAMWQMGVYGEDMPWYDCVKNIWQDDTCTWEPVINQAKEELCKLYQLSTEN